MLFRSGIRIVRQLPLQKYISAKRRFRTWKPSLSGRHSTLGSIFHQHGKSRKFRHMQKTYQKWPEIEFSHESLDILGGIFHANSWTVISISETKSRGSGQVPHIIFTGPFLAEKNTSENKSLKALKHAHGMKLQTNRNLNLDAFFMYPPSCIRLSRSSFHQFEWPRLPNQPPNDPIPEIWGARCLSQASPAY